VPSLAASLSQAREWREESIGARFGMVVVKVTGQVANHECS
jgi:hypothetical protein